MSKPKLIHTDDCAAPNPFQYWHECADMCAVDQCMNCAAWATACGSQSKQAAQTWPSVFDMQHLISAYETVLLDLAKHDWFDRSSADIIPTGLADRRQFLQAKLADITNANNQTN